MANEQGEFLFFDRVKHPFGLTVPAGHVDFNEKPLQAGVRELREETSIVASSLRPCVIDNIWGDECRRGADVHRWHIFATRLPAGQTVKVDASEGAAPVWMTLAAARQAPLTPALRHIVRHHSHALLAAIT
ncbi:MAG TPA: NUDIX hydrolase [Verrucomicrobiae bacterium]|nr:NUDIX hydrolase [Verrucomicrobiae bacterium]